MTRTDATTRATQAAQTLNAQWFPAPDFDPYWTGGAGFWHSANALQAFVDYAQATGDRRFDGVIDPAYQSFLPYFDPSNGSPHYYDDEGWWGVAIQCAFVLTGNDGYRQTAEAIFTDLTNGWDETYCGGGLWQMRANPSYPANFKSSISNELLFDLAGRLYRQADGRSPADKQVFLDWAKKVWAWFDRAGFAGSSGFVWGGVHPACPPTPGSSVPDANNPPCTYTQGVVLGGLMRLHEATGDTGLLDSGIRFADAAVQSMVTSDCILRERCERSDLSDQDPGNCDNDAKQFKGVFMRYLAPFCTALTGAGGTYAEAATRYRGFVARNADSLAAAYPGGVYGLSWSGSYPDYQPSDTPFVAGTLQTSALDCFTAATSP
jgi:predicted alpha-1,6-mannanase (GH76 family)